MSGFPDQNAANCRVLIRLVRALILIFGFQSGLRCYVDLSNHEWMDRAVIAVLPGGCEGLLVTCPRGQRTGIPATLVIDQGVRNTILIQPGNGLAGLNGD